MSLIEAKKIPLVALPFLKKRLRRVTALGLRNLDITDYNFAVYFTLHRTSQTVAFYTSEAIANQRSPEWSHLTFPFCVQCLENFLLRVWVKSGQGCRLFSEYDIHLNQSLLPDAQIDDSLWNNNSLWIEMFGYRFSDDESNEKPIESIPPPDMTLNTGGKKSTSKRVQYPKSYSKSSTTRMMTCIQSIREEKRASAACLETLQNLAHTNDDYLSKIKEQESRRFYNERLKEYLECQEAICAQRLAAHKQRQQQLEERRDHLSQNLPTLINQIEELKSKSEALKQSKLTLQDLMQLVAYRQKSIVREIYAYVYPIKVEQKTEYSIANIKLPAAEDKIYQTSLSRDRLYEIEAAIGFSAHLVLIISQFIQLPLRFPIEFHGKYPLKIYDYSLTSTGLSLDPSSKNEVFAYAFFLLNRNIGQILDYCRVGARNPDYRRTLENLKEIMEKYFMPMNINYKAETNSVNYPPTTGVPIPIRKISTVERTETRSSRNSTLTPIFRSLNSSRSSLNDESQNFDQSEQNDQEMEPYPRSNTISPRLTMQYSFVPQK